MQVVAIWSKCSIGLLGEVAAYSDAAQFSVIELLGY